MNRKYVVKKNSTNFYELWVEYRVDGSWEPVAKRGLSADILEVANRYLENDAQHGIVSHVTIDMRGVGYDGQPSLEV